MLLKTGRRAPRNRQRAPRAQGHLDDEGHVLVARQTRRQAHVERHSSIGQRRVGRRPAARRAAAASHPSPVGHTAQGLPARAEAARCFNVVMRAH